MELGVCTFGDLGADPESGERLSAVDRFRHLLEEAGLAEQAGLDLDAEGGHHRPGCAVSAPAVAPQVRRALRRAAADPPAAEATSRIPTAQNLEGPQP